MIVNVNRDVIGDTPCKMHRKKVVAYLRDYVCSRFAGLDVTLLVHGSYATGDVTEFSDIDVLAFIPSFMGSGFKRLFEKRLLDLTYHLHRRDPLMHHNVDVVAIESLRCYDESNLPIDSISKSVVLFGKDHFHISSSTCESRRRAAEKLIGVCESIVKYDCSIVNRTPYRLKCMISTLFLIPVLLLQADKGVFLYKRESLALAFEEYGRAIDFEVIRQASRMRASWRLPRAAKVSRAMLVPFESSLISPLWLQRISGSMFPIPRCSVEEFFALAHKFSKDVLLYAKANNIV